MPANIYKNAEGLRVPGVTTVIGSNLGWSKGGLMHWAWQQGIDGLDYKATRDKAADTGTIAHAMVENEVKGIKFEWPKLGYDLGGNAEQVKQAENAFAAFVEWKELVKFELMFSEHLLVSEKHQFGGQIDIAAVQSKRAIIDIKTSNAVYEDHKIQIAAYGELWNENYPDKLIEAYYILQLGKDGSFTYHYYPNLDNAFRAFLLLRELHDLKKIL
jgi:hypothetical protein